jgi:SAM-dependent methyltransferase
MKDCDLYKLLEQGFARDFGRVKKAEGIAYNLGAGNKLLPNAIALDLPAWDGDFDRIPADDASIDCIYAYHFLEHLKNPIDMLRECQRVLKSGGVVNIVVPYYNSNLQASDLDHKCVFTEDTWKCLFNNEYYTKDKEGWMFNINFNMICGLVERNLCLVTQLEKQ